MKSLAESVGAPFSAATLYRRAAPVPSGSSYSGARGVVDDPVVGILSGRCRGEGAGGSAPGVIAVKIASSRPIRSLAETKPSIRVDIVRRQCGGEREGIGGAAADKDVMAAFAVEHIDAVIAENAVLEHVASEVQRVGRSGGSPRASPPRHFPGSV